MIMAEQAVSFTRNGHGPLVHGNGLHNASLTANRHAHAHGGEGRQMTKVFKALSDGTRQEILRLLETNQRTVGEIVGNFHLSQPTISRHLSVLKEADLVVDQRHGQNVIYRLNDLALSASMREFFGQFRSCQSELR
jgi:DNA-binding transcriptional ArsR family regulator